jgi:hypothetical protein
MDYATSLNVKMLCFRSPATTLPLEISAIAQMIRAARGSFNAASSWYDNSNYKLSASVLDCGTVSMFDTDAICMAGICGGASYSDECGVAFATWRRLGAPSLPGLWTQYKAARP